MSEAINGGSAPCAGPCSPASADMGTLGLFQAEKLVIGILSSRTEENDTLVPDLASRFGAVDYSSAWLPFDFTRYYDEEMGGGIRRMFVSFGRLVDPAKLSGIKAETNRLEDGYREQGRRKVNLDPGLLCLSRFVLASTKESSHRIPLSAGIYAEVTLVFERGSFRPVEWTYPDYRSETYISILNEIRGLYRRQVGGSAYVSMLQ
jgi:hypothetical protein